MDTKLVSMPKSEVKLLANQSQSQSNDGMVVILKEMSMLVGIPTRQKTSIAPLKVAGKMNIRRWIFLFIGGIWTRSQVVLQEMDP